MRGEGIALPLTFIVMFFVFGGFIAAGMPIAGAFVSIGGALLSLFAFSHLVDLDATRRQHRHPARARTLDRLRAAHGEPLPRGAARGREHRVPSPEEVSRAAERTVATAGRTVLFSGLIVAIALSGLLLFEAAIMRAIGVAGVSVVLVAMVVAVTLVPALCVLGARRLARKAAAPTSDAGLFSRLAGRRAAPTDRRHRRRRRRARHPRAADPVDAAHLVGHRAAPGRRRSSGSSSSSSPATTPPSRLPRSRSWRARPTPRP